MHVLQIGAVTRGQKGEELAAIEKWRRREALRSVKTAKSVMNAKLLRDAMKITQKLDIPVLSHCEDKNLVDGGVVNADANAKREGLRGITNSVEDVIIARDIMISEGYRRGTASVPLLDKEQRYDGADGKRAGRARDG